jgi:hypothetical protein
MEKRGKDGKIERKWMPSCYLAHGLGKLKPKIENPGGNASRRLRLDLCCSAIAAAAAATTYTVVQEHWHIYSWSRNTLGLLNTTIYCCVYRRPPL